MAPKFASNESLFQYLNITQKLNSNENEFSKIRFNKLNQVSNQTKLKIGNQFEEKEATTTTVTLNNNEKLMFNIKTIIKPVETTTTMLGQQFLNLNNQILTSKPLNLNHDRNKSNNLRDITLDSDKNVIQNKNIRPKYENDFGTQIKNNIATENLNYNNNAQYKSYLNNTNINEESEINAINLKKFDNEFYFPPFISTTTPSNHAATAKIGAASAGFYTF